MFPPRNVIAVVRRSFLRSSPQLFFDLHSGKKIRCKACHQLQGLHDWNGITDEEYDGDALIPFGHALMYSYMIALLCKIGALRSFSLEKLLYWRERASGMSSLAYFLSRDTIDHFNTVIKPIVYLSMFYFFNNPRSSITDNYIILLALVYCVTGIGYAFAIFFQTGSAQFWSALLPVILTLIATQPSNSKWLKNLCYTKWALEAFVISNAKSRVLPVRRDREGRSCPGGQSIQRSPTRSPTTLPAIGILKLEVENLGDLDPSAEILIRLLCAVPGWT